MTDIQIHVATSHQSTCVSNTFIDCFMPDASGEFVKIYLYLLRVLSSGDRHFNPSAMADKFHYTENDIRRGLSYWEQMHLLSIRIQRCQSTDRHLSFRTGDRMSIRLLRLQSPLPPSR